MCAIYINRHSLPRKMDAEESKVEQIEQVMPQTK